LQFIGSEKQKPADGTAAADLMYNILCFLDLRPLSLADESSFQEYSQAKFFEEHVAALLSCLIIDDARMIALASNVVIKASRDLAIFILSNSSSDYLVEFYISFWRSTSTVLLAVAQTVISPGPHGTQRLGFIHDYLGIRLNLEKKYPVG
jgi:hypothetical protein